MGSEKELKKVNLINNLREKFSPGPGFEPRSPALHAGALTTKPPDDPLGQARS